MAILATYFFFFCVGSRLLLSEALFEWNCGHKYLENVTLKAPKRYPNCIPLPNPPLESLEGTDEILNTTHPLNDPIKQCAKAATGRGVRQFAFINRKCHAIPMVEPKWPVIWRCVFKRQSKHRRSYCIEPLPYYTKLCIKKVITKCECGSSYGGADYLIQYTMKSYLIGLWIEVDDVFNNTATMFDKTSTKYIQLYNSTKALVFKAINETKTCGVSAEMNTIDKMVVRPVDTNGKVAVRLQTSSSFMNPPEVHGLLKAMPIITSSQQLNYPILCQGFLYLEITSTYGSTQATATKYNRMFQTALTFKITVKCNGTDPEIEYDFKLAKISESGQIANYTNMCNGTAYNVRRLQIYNCTIQPFSLTDGIYYAAMTAQSKTYGFSRDYKHGFIRMTKAPLIASIRKESAACFYTPGQRLWINASNSFDRNIYETAEEAPADDLKYTWACRLSTQSPITSSSVKSLPIVRDGVSTGEIGGCFSNGVGRLQPITISLVFQSNSITAGKIIVFELFVTKDERSAKTTLACKVVPSPPKHGLRCKFNCGALMKTTTRLGLEPYCGDPRGCTAKLVHSWTIWLDTGKRVDIGYGPTEPVFSQVTSYKSLTQVTNLYFVLGEYSLEQNQTYKIRHTVENIKKGQYISEYIFTTNVLPYGGKCEADKTTIKAAVDLVQIMCSDWRDYEDNLFRYEAWVQVRDQDQPIMLFFGSSDKFFMKLPLGNSENGFSTKVIVKVFDAYESTDFILNLTVSLPALQKLGADLLDMLHFNDDDDYQRRAQMGIASLSLITYKGTGNITIPLSNKTQIRSQIISSMMGAPINGSRNIKLASYVLVETTSNIEELSFEGQEQSISAAFMLSQALSVTNDTDDPFEFDKTGSTLLHLAGNVIDGTSLIKVDDDVSENDGSEKVEQTKKINSTQLKNLAQTALSTTESLSLTLLSKMLGGEISKKYNTPSIGLEITKTESSKLPKDYSIKGGGIVASSDLVSFMENATKCPVNKACLAAESFISSKTLFSKNNPFIWGNGTIKVKSPVISFEYLTSTGEVIPVDGLENEFTMRIPVKEPKRPKKESEFPNFVTPDTDCVQHKFSIGKNDTAFELIITLAEEKYTEVYVRYGRRATKTNYDYKYYHPDLSSCVEPPERDNCTGIYDFMECMGLDFVQTLNKTSNETRNNTQYGNLNDTSNFGGARYDNTTMETKCAQANVTVPDISFLANSSHQRNLSVCYDYHKLVACPPCPVFVNNSGNGTTGNSNFMDYSEFMKNISKYRPDCGNGTNETTVTVLDRYGNATNITKPVVCPKAQKFLDCKNRTVEQYQKCKSLLTRKNLIYYRYEKCYKNIHRRFFGLDTFNESGWYYVAMCYNSTQVPPLTTSSVPTTPQNTTEIQNSTTSNNTIDRNSNNKTNNWRRRETQGSLRTKRSFDYKDYDSEGVFNSDELVDPLENRDLQNQIDQHEATLLDVDDYASGVEASHKVLRRSRRETTQRKCAVVDEKPAPTAPPIPTEFSPVRPQKFNASTSLNYSFDINLFCCLFWNATTEIWSTNGCRPHKNSSATEVVCLCNHLTSFGSDLLVAPNLIDFDKVLAGFANLGTTGNFAVLFTIIGLILIYGLAVVIARHADKLDYLLVSKTRVGSIDPNREGLNYEVMVSTGTFRGSGTTANVAMVIHGERGNTQVIPLADETGSSADILCRGNVVYIMINIPENIGDIHYIRIWHNNEGDDPAWFMRQITVRHVATNKEWLFFHNDWFAVDKGDGKIDRRLYVASEHDKSQFKSLFYSHTTKGFSEKHLWVSVVLRPPTSTFTRVQRVSCCFSLLFTAMLVNAMFYLNDSENDDTIHIGPIKMSLKQIIIGIESGLIIAPINLLIMTLFRKARPKNAARKKGNENSDAQDKSDGKKSGKKKGLPHWVVYVAYVLCALSILASATVVVFYSMMWGTEKSNAWMASVVLSLIQDILLVQPLKVLVLAVLLSFIFRKPPEEDANQIAKDPTKKTDNEKSEGQSYDIFSKEIIRDPEVSYKPLDSEEVLEVQTYQIRKNTIRRAIKEIVLHLVFTIMLGFMVIGSQSSHRYYITKHLNDVFPGSEKVTDANKFWSWCERVLLPRLYQNKWYNGQTFTDETEGFISTKKATLIGMPRLRQGRVKPENCEATKDYAKLQEMFPKCYPHYSRSQADESSPTSSNNPKGDVNLNDSVLSGEIGFERMCLQPFLVQSAEKLGTLPVATSDKMYSGSGMVADLGYDYETASEVVLNLKADRWIARQTRIVFAEFVVFEPTSALYAFARFTFEQLPTGSILSSSRIEPFALYGVGQSSFKTAIDMIELVFLVFVIVLFVRMIITLVREKLQFFKDFWNLHQVVMLSLSLAMMGLNFVRESYTRKLIKAIQVNPYSRMSFDYVQYGTDVFNALACVVIFLATLKLIKLFNFNMKIQTFVLVLRLSKPFLVTYGTIFIIVFLAFAQAAHIIFGQVIPMYANLLRSFVNVFQMAFGKGLFFHDLKDIDGVLGPLFIFCYFMTTTLLLVNFFVAILNDGYADGCDEVSNETNEDAIMSAFMTAYIKVSLEDISKSLKADFPMSSKNKRLHRLRQRDKSEIPKTKREMEAEYFLY